ncbi:cytochrome c oxidase subunit 7A-related protein, mitochondrial-like [Zalophus californianus]|uniref:Cytochrome c oxidase subunit 7A-related protein, mitochondrial-like n=1 Tax=Zalophus californianus TaxID=9704 RepID=A0A6P9FHF1_ZALCA|nr:cytochrome c oxidase subunit 7A-related protein, mitochondrial-like [Zalophus californianus]
MGKNAPDRELNLKIHIENNSANIEIKNSYMDFRMKNMDEAEAAGSRTLGVTYYKFSGLTQMLTGTWASDAYSPQGLRLVVSTEAPPIIFATPTKLSSDFAVYDYAGKNKVPELQKFFQKSHGVPIHLKRDLPDQMLYWTTMVLTLGGGTICCLIALYMASWPRNK